MLPSICIAFIISGVIIIVLIYIFCFVLLSIK